MGSWVQTDLDCLLLLYEAISIVVNEIEYLQLAQLMGVPGGLTCNKSSGRGGYNYDTQPIERDMARESETWRERE